MSASENGRPVVLTQGDPRGVGPELLLAAAARGSLRPGDLVVADMDHMRAVAGRLAVSWAAQGLEALGAVEVMSRPGLTQSDALAQGVDRVLAAKGQAALVTAPIHKARAAAEGFAYPGHTEYLAARAGVDDFAMAMIGPTLRVCLVTIHEPLRAVADLITTARVVRSGRLLASALRDLVGLTRPRIAVLGLNPHAGEGGLLGGEEGALIAPAVEQLRRDHGEEAEFSGPLAADTAFPFHQAGRFDALVAMYHDQALAPFKLLHLHDGVNVTLGLPFWRTSPDHGTADDIAGTGRVDPRSFLHALALARGKPLWINS